MPEHALSAMRSLIEWGGPWPLFLWGGIGAGKTCSALALIDHTGGMYFTGTGLAEQAILASKGQIKTSTGRPLTGLGFWEEIDKTSLVVLDELGLRDRATEWQYECLKRALDAREGQPLIAISNLGLEELAERYDDRVASRLAAGTIVKLLGGDRRLA